MPPTISRLAALQAIRSGAAAQRAGAPVTACPHDPNGPAEARFLTRFWLRGWTTARKLGPGPTGTSTTLDAAP